MESNKGYINIVAVMQKFFDQAISGNWSYNPEHYPDNEVPVSVMAQDLLTTYKYGWKTSYYQNTYDSKTDEIEPAHPIGWHDNVEEVGVQRQTKLNNLLDELSNVFFNSSIFSSDSPAFCVSLEICLCISTYFLRLSCSALYKCKCSTGLYDSPPFFKAFSRSNIFSPFSFNISATILASL